jgi:hypothetical protein
MGKGKVEPALRAGLPSLHGVQAPPKCYAALRFPMATETQIDIS